LRVYDSPLAKKVELGSTHKPMFCLLTQNSVIVVGGRDDVDGGNFVSGDIGEVNDAQRYSAPQRLQILNDNKDRNNELVDIIMHFRVNMMARKGRKKEQ
jgi:hypothetical protein